MENNKLFCYGILKRGYELDLNNYGAKYLGEAVIPGAVLYGIGRRYEHETHPNDGREFSGVGLKLDVDPSGVEAAHGELWEVPADLWTFLDQIESNGRVYTRKEVKVLLTLREENGKGPMLPYGIETAWVYVHNYAGFAEKDKIKGGVF